MREKKIDSLHQKNYTEKKLITNTPKQIDQNVQKKSSEKIGQS